MTYSLDLNALTDSISDRALEQLCQENPELKFETDVPGKLIIMSPTGSLTGERNADLIYQVQSWNRQYQLGKVFGSSTGFKLSNGATRSPDVSWIAINRWNSLSEQQQAGFAPIDPDFVIELMSPLDDLLIIQRKMKEYMSCGVKLGWLINPDQQEVEIYCLGHSKQVINHPRHLFREDILPGLTVNFSNIF